MDLKFSRILYGRCFGGSPDVHARMFELFLGSIVAYSNEVKVKLLGIDESILNEYGAISEPIASQMAQEVLRLTGSDYSLAVSGIAGPGGGTASKPIGTICAALARRQELPLVWTFQLEGSREAIIAQAAEALLNRLWLSIRNYK